MIVSEFIEWLKTQDQGATVYVIQVTQGYGYQDDTSEVEFDPDLSMYIDLRGNPNVTPDKSYYNARSLTLGEL